MIWKKHYVKTDHAFLSASKWHWVNYDTAKLKESWRSFRAAQEGTELHAWAAQTIKLAIRQRGKSTLASYINDAIGFRLSPEVLLYYSENCFGTADAIGYDEKEHILRIFDLKTGKIPAHFEQLIIYAALFCLDYDLKPTEFRTELRIYQNDEIKILEPTTDEIAHVMSTIITFDKEINKIRLLEG